MNDFIVVWSCIGFNNSPAVIPAGDDALCNRSFAVLLGETVKIPVLFTCPIFDETNGGEYYNPMKCTHYITNMK